MKYLIAMFCVVAFAGTASAGNCGAFFSAPVQRVCVGGQCAQQVVVQQPVQRVVVRRQRYAPVQQVVVQQQQVHSPRVVVNTRGFFGARRAQVIVR